MSLTIPERRILIVIIGAHFALLSFMGLFRHWGNMSSLNDLGFFDQAVWGTLHGQWFLDTNNVFGRPINWLGCHFNLFLLLFVPLYGIWPAVEWFAIAQAFALSIAAWPIFLLAGRVHGSERTGLMWAVIYLLNPFLLSAAAWDFHPVSLAVPLIAGALLAVEKKDFRLLMVCCLCLLLIQEQFGITVAGFGALWWIKSRNWKTGLLLTGVGFLYTILVPGIIMPALHPTGVHPMIAPGAPNSRYGWLGNSVFEIFDTVLFHPIWTLKAVFLKYEGLSYLIFLALPFLGLFLAEPLWLLPAIADFAVNILSAIPLPRMIISYHSVTLVPILTVAACYGVRRIAPLLGKTRASFLTWCVLFFTSVNSYALAPLPLPGAINYWQPVRWAQLPDPALKQIRELVAKHSSVCVQADVGAHFSQNRQVYRYPYKVGEADTIVLWLASPTLNVDPRKGYGVGMITHHLQMKPAKYLASIDCLLRDPRYGIVLWKDPWLVLSRGAKGVGAEEMVRNRLTLLRHAWSVSSEEYEAAFHEIKHQ